MIREFKSQYNPDLTLKSDKDEGASSATVVSAKKNKQEPERGKWGKIAEDRVEKPWNQWKVKRLQIISELMEADLKYLQAHTRYSRKQIKDQFVAFRNDCPEGHLDKNVFSELYGAMAPPGAHVEHHVEQIFRIFDRDGNGIISFREFVMATDMTTAGTPEEKLKWAFKLYDKDASGTIDIAELVDTLDTLHAMSAVDITEEDLMRKARQIFENFDIDGDGDISEEEFVDGGVWFIKVRRRYRLMKTDIFRCMKDEELVKMLTAPSVRRKGAQQQLVSKKDMPANAVDNRLLPIEETE